MQVTESAKDTLQSSVGRIFMVAAVAGPFFVIALLWLANTLLPQSDAEAFKAPLLALWGTVTGTSGVGAIISHLIAKWTKMATQRQIATNSTTDPNGAALTDDGEVDSQ